MGPRLIYFFIEVTDVLLSNGLDVVANLREMHHTILLWRVNICCAEIWTWKKCCFGRKWNGRLNVLVFRIGWMHVLQAHWFIQLQLLLHCAVVVSTLWHEHSSKYTVSIFCHSSIASTVTDKHYKTCHVNGKLQFFICPTKVGRIMVWRMSSFRPSVNIWLCTGVTTCRISFNFTYIIYLVCPIHDTGNGSWSSYWPNYLFSHFGNSWGHFSS